MKPFRYRLVVTTDGRPGLLERTLDSFFAKVQPEPVELVIVDDSGDEDRRRYLDALCADYSNFGFACGYLWHPERLGFCATVADAWEIAAAPGPPWVFWTEDDFQYLRSFHLADLANVLAHEPDLAQMGLMRHPVNERERAAGGLYEMNRDRYALRGAGSLTWLRSRTNFSTTSSLLRRSFMVECPWPEYDSECEGRYSIDLLARGYEFAVWGDGNPWIVHRGDVRVGSGY